MEKDENKIFRRTNRADFLGPVYLGASLDQTGSLNFFNSASLNATTFQAGNATAAVTYTFPTGAPASNGQFLSGTTAGILSWASAMLYADTRFFTGVLTRVKDATSANVSYTGVGFQPKVVLFLAGNGAALSWGFDTVSASGSTFAFGSAFSDANSASIDIYDSSGFSAGQKGRINTMDSDGFTIAWTKVGAPATGNINIYYLALR